MDQKPETKASQTKAARARPAAAPDPRAFYLVWSPEGGDPVVRFPTFEAAKHSAWRLSQRYPGQDFFVLRSCWGRLARPAEVNATSSEAGAEQGEPRQADPPQSTD
jgi:hypothetical protein